MTQAKNKASNNFGIVQRTKQRCGEHTDGHKGNRYSNIVRIQYLTLSTSVLLGLLDRITTKQENYYRKVRNAYKTPVRKYH